MRMGRVDGRRHHLVPASLCVSVCVSVCVCAHSGPGGWELDVLVCFLPCILCAH